MGEVDDGTDTPLFTGNVPVVAPPDFEPVRPALDHEKRVKIVGGIVNAAETAVVVVVDTKIKNKTSNPELIERYTSGAKIPPEGKGMLIDDLADVWEKYFPDLNIGPGVVSATVIGLWLKGVHDLVKSINAMPESIPQAKAA